MRKFVKLTDVYGVERYVDKSARFIITRRQNIMLWGGSSPEDVTQVEVAINENTTDSFYVRMLPSEVVDMLEQKRGIIHEF